MKFQDEHGRVLMGISEALVLEVGEKYLLKCIPSETLKYALYPDVMIQRKTRNVPQESELSILEE